MTVLSGVSVDDQLTDGDFMCDDTCTELPPKQSAGILEVFVATDNVIFQRFTGLANYNDGYLTKYERFVFADSTPGAIETTWQKTN